MVKKINLNILLLLLLISTNTLASSVITTIIKSNYKDVRNNILDSIEEKALNVANVYHASDMLKRTKNEVFNLTNIYSKVSSNIKTVLSMPIIKIENTDKTIGIKNIYKNAEIIEFCSAKISHELVLANPDNIALCPFKIAIYSLNSHPDQTHIVYTKLNPLDKKSIKPTAKANELILSLVMDASW
ncbi:hypothetical protein CRYPA_46 [uncultured Candidatus Thioglobus sp.]|nr:hypothetical protein CRYPA_46 [uncultured Candidatus Thioglobus sp.]